jgi:hypothetical protein
VGINAFGSAVDLALRIKLKKDGGASGGTLPCSTQALLPFLGDR